MVQRSPHDQLNREQFIRAVPEPARGLDESGLAYTWLMQRLDHTYLTRSSEAHEITRRIHEGDVLYMPADGNGPS